MNARERIGQFRRVVLGLLARTAPCILLAPLLASGTLVTEDFAYAPASYNEGGLSGKNGGSGWTTAWSTGTTRIEVTSGSLSYAGGGYGIVQETSSNKAGSGYGGEPRGLYRGLGPMTGGVWFSCLMFMEPTFTTPEVTLQFNPTTDNNVYSANYVQLKGTSINVRYGGTDSLNVVTGLTQGNAVLVVGQLEVGVGNDAISLWVNPADLEEIGTPVFSQSGSDLGDNLFRIGLMGYRGSTSGAPRATMDALRISDGGGDWAQAFFEVTGVMPFIPEPGAGVLFLTGIGTLLAGRRHGRQ